MGLIPDVGSNMKFEYSQNLKVGDFIVINNPDTNQYIWTQVLKIKSVKIIDKMDIRRFETWPVVQTCHCELIFDPHKRVQVCYADENLSLSDVVDMPICC